MQLMTAIKRFKHILTARKIKIMRRGRLIKAYTNDIKRNYSIPSYSSTYGKISLNFRWMQFIPLEKEIDIRTLDHMLIDFNDTITEETRDISKTLRLEKPKVVFSLYNNKPVLSADVDSVTIDDTDLDKEELNRTMNKMNFEQY